MVSLYICSTFKVITISRWRISINFNEMEKQLKQPVASYMIEDPVRRAEKWIEEQKEKKVA